MRGREFRPLIDFPTLRRRAYVPALALVGAAGVLLLVAVPLLRWLALLILLAWLAVRRPVWALALLPFAVAFGSLAQLTWAGIHAGPTDLLLATLALGWVVRRTSGSRNLTPQPPSLVREGGALADLTPQPPSLLEGRGGQTALPTFFVASWLHIDRIARSVATRRAGIPAGPAPQPSAADGTADTQSRETRCSAGEIARAPGIESLDETWWQAKAAHGRAWLAQQWSADALKVALFGALGAYLLVILATAIVAISRVAVAKEAVKWTEVTLTVALTLWLARSSLRRRGLVWALIGAGVAQALLGYAQWALAAGDLGPGGASLRVFGTFGQPNPYAGFLNFALLPALALALWSAEARERWVAGAAAALLFGASWLAGSRGALLGLGAGVVVMLAVGWRKERQVGLAALVGVPLVALAWLFGLIPQSLLARMRLAGVSLNGPVNDANFSDVERLAHWVAGLRMFAAHPLLGVGAGNYDAAYARYAVPGWPEPLGHAHNYYINAAAETGVLGLAAFLAIAALALLIGWRAARAPRDRPGDGGEADLALGLLAVVVAVLVHSLTDDLFVHAMELTFGLALGLLLALGRVISTDTGHRHTCAGSGKP